MSRLVMIHGAYWGVGQSTLTRRLAEAIPDVDVLWEDEESQPAIFTRAEFSAVAERFHAHNANPSAGLGHPPPEMLEDAYRAVVDTVLDHGRTALMGWSVMDLAEDLDWARADEDALKRHSGTVRALLGPLDPVLVFIDADPEVAFERVVAQRGRKWFDRRLGGEEPDWPSLRRMVMDEAAVAEGRTRRALSAGGWLPGIEVNGSRLGPDQVLDVVADPLRLRGIKLAVSPSPPPPSP